MTAVTNAEDETGPGSLVGLVCQLSFVTLEQQIKQNALMLGRCDKRADPEDPSVEFWLFRNDMERQLLERQIRLSVSSQVYLTQAIRHDTK